jgi:cellulose synthase/poly-beta-1,6-N-acetylglucosamine synthase-like glycosyltransferase
MAAGADRLSIVVETNNDDPTHDVRLPASLAALARQTLPIERCEVLVVLGKSSPGLAEVVRDVLPHARILVPDRDLGYGQMKMYGARAAASEIVAFTDADCTVGRDWVAAVLEGFRDAPDTVAALQGQTRHAEGPGWQAATLLYCRAMWSPARRGRYLVLNNFAIRRSMVDRFPFADVPARQNVERLMVTRMRAAGYKIRVEPRMSAIHTYRAGWKAWFHRGRAEAFDRLETVRSVYPLMESPARVATLCRLDRRLWHHTRRLGETLHDLVRCRRDLEVGPGALLASGLAALTIWAGTCLGAWQASRGGARPPTDF